MLEEGFRHVVTEQHSYGEKALCGAVVWRHDMPIQLDHAKRCIEQGTYLQPCEECIQAAEELKK